MLLKDARSARFSSKTTTMKRSLGAWVPADLGADGEAGPCGSCRVRRNAQSFGPTTVQFSSLQSFLLECFHYRLVTRIFSRGSVRSLPLTKAQYIRSSRLALKTFLQNLDHPCSKPQSEIQMEQMVLVEHCGTKRHSNTQVSSPGPGETSGANYPRTVCIP